MRRFLEDDQGVVILKQNLISSRSICICENSESLSAELQTLGRFKRISLYAVRRFVRAGDLSEAGEPIHDVPSVVG